MNILTVAESIKGKPKRTAFEALTTARKLAGAGGGVFVVVAGTFSDEAKSALAKFGATKIFFGEDEQLNRLNPEAALELVKQAAAEAKPDAILLSASFFGKELAGRLSGALHASVATDCIDVSAAGDALLVKRPMFAGKVIASVRLTGSTKIVSLRPNTVGATEQPAQAEAKKLTIDSAKLKTTVEKLELAESKRPELTEADIIVSGGRGMKGPEHYNLIEALADQLGAAVGSSRAVVDAGWRPHSEQVGQTGKVVSPKLYVACGISGAVQHYAGMGSSKCIVAINKDAEAPIFKKCDYGIVGDVFEILPLLTSQLKSVAV